MVFNPALCRPPIKAARKEIAMSIPQPIADQLEVIKTADEAVDVAREQQKTADNARDIAVTAAVEAEGKTNEALTNRQAEFDKLLVLLQAEFQD